MGARPASASALEGQRPSYVNLQITASVGDHNRAFLFAWGTAPVSPLKVCT